MGTIKAFSHMAHCSVPVSQYVDVSSALEGKLYSVKTECFDMTV